MQDHGVVGGVGSRGGGRGRITGCGEDHGVGGVGSRGGEI